MASSPRSRMRASRHCRSRLQHRRPCSTHASCRRRLIRLQKMRPSGARCGPLASVDRDPCQRATFRRTPCCRPSLVVAARAVQATSRRRAVQPQHGASACLSSPAPAPARRSSASRPSPRTSKCAARAATPRMASRSRAWSMLETPISCSRPVCARAARRSGRASRSLSPRRSPSRRARAVSKRRRSSRMRCRSSSSRLRDMSPQAFVCIMLVCEAWCLTAKCARMMLAEGSSRVQGPGGESSGRKTRPMRSGTRRFSPAMSSGAQAALLPTGPAEGQTIAASSSLPDVRPAQARGSARGTHAQRQTGTGTIESDCC
ncbi:hypothetical protein FA09DRAFT_70978 [Tilletiopsis washingtonensis]|uniref:Uncharacterized protein n=1 Tax=Tilletiopsis washingtonensis TaxID=58919 RepID=A0A316Z5P8_9BASI|nr:hypothetical protein FA09DRAFT_70978 [Tilletiopsis washingtonensis]PWN96881.1 hypothetical protein FA09DRAFT_70978 [Tilletiopsis washingtonensis]